MDDSKIIELYMARDMSAISKTSTAYGGYLRTIAHNILHNVDDEDECLNDTYLKCWNSIPPAHPKSLKTFLAKIIRNISIDRYRLATSVRHGNGQTALVLDELSECVSGDFCVESEIEKRELVDTITEYLNTLPETHRNVFICRYWYVYDYESIARISGVSLTNVSTILGRVRTGLKRYLNERGYDI